MTIILATASLVTLTVILLYIVQGILPFRMGFEFKRTVLSPTTSQITFTFDDGPDPEATPAILDMLKKYNRKAFFFLIGENAIKYPEIVERIFSEGHMIGNHSFSHPSMLFNRSSLIMNELVKCQDAIKKITGEVPRYVRPPYGQRDFRFYQQTENLGLTTALWTHDTYDYLNVSDEFIRRRIFSAKPGDIILSHDRYYKRPEVLRALDDWLALNG